MSWLRRNPVTAELQAWVKINLKLQTFCVARISKGIWVMELYRNHYENLRLWPLDCLSCSADMYSRDMGTKASVTTDRKTVCRSRPVNCMSCTHRATCTQFYLEWSQELRHTEDWVALLCDSRRTIVCCRALRSCRGSVKRYVCDWPKTVMCRSCDTCPSVDHTWPGVQLFLSFNLKPQSQRIVRHFVVAEP